MMDYFISGSLSALWLGILTSLSPCPLATNIAAISFLSKNIQSVRSVLLSGIIYTFGRMLTYIGIAVIAIIGLSTIPKLSHFLQKYMNMILGPILIITGMFLLELLTPDFSSRNSTEGAKKLASKGKYWSAGLLGVLFALSFCPVTAALFFGSLIPLSLNYNSDIILPALYGAGTGLPVLLFAVVISTGSKSIALIYKKISSIEIWARRLTGFLLVGIGIYLSLDHIFELF